jgi:hypothetical protein
MLCNLEIEKLFCNPRRRKNGGKRYKVFAKDLWRFVEIKYLGFDHLILFYGSRELVYICL